MNETTPHETPEAEEVEALAREHARHSALYATQYDGRGGIAHEDHGGLWCSCGEWDSGPRKGSRPYDEWHAHVVQATILAAGYRKADPVRDAELPARSSASRCPDRECRYYDPVYRMGREAELRAEGAREAAAALRHYADGFINSPHTAEQWREAASYLSVRASLGISRAALTEAGDE